MQSLVFDLDHYLQDAKLAHLLEIFSQTLLRWAKIHNLTGAKTKDEVKEQMKDSLAPICFLKPFQTCIDIGSGAGFPALILACYYPNAQFYLLEPRLKRVSFLENAILTMGLKNVKICADFSYNIHDIKADLITSRAVCASNTLIEQSLHLLNPCGHYLLFKGSDSLNQTQELTAWEKEIFTHNQRIFIYAHAKEKQPKISK